jgi:hypothetical protein
MHLSLAVYVQQKRLMEPQYTHAIYTAGFMTARHCTRCTCKSRYLNPEHMDLDTVTLTAMAQGWTAQGEVISGVDVIDLPITPGAPGIDMSVYVSNQYNMGSNDGECSWEVLQWCLQLQHGIVAHSAPLWVLWIHGVAMHCLQS